MVLTWSFLKNKTKRNKKNHMPHAHSPATRGTDANKSTPVRIWAVHTVTARPDTMDMVTKIAVYAGTSTRDTRNAFRWMLPASLPEFNVSP